MLKLNGIFKKSYKEFEMMELNYIFYIINYIKYFNEV